jgi:hypothetical protein
MVPDWRRSMQPVSRKEKRPPPFGSGRWTSSQDLAVPDLADAET